MRTVRTSGLPRRTTVEPDARQKRRTKGQALVEFALVIPVMLLLVVSGLDAGRLFFSWIEVSNAAREAAAYAGGNPTDTSGITAHATTEANAQKQGGEGTMSVAVTCADTARVTIACSSAPGGSGTGNTVTVQVTRPFSFVTPIIGNLLGNSVSLTGSATSAVYGLQPNDGSDGVDDCDPPTLASFSVAISNMTVNVDASASTPNSGRCAIATYDWDWGDGVDNFPPPIGKQTTYTYGTPNTWTITLTVQNPGGDLSTTYAVTVPPPSPSPTATPTPSPTPTDTPSPSPTNPCSMTPTFTYTVQGGSGKVNFFGAYTGQPAPASWFWWFGDGAVGSGQAPAQHKYSGSGPYTVVLLVTNGSCQNTVSANIDAT
jgi:PKD repeat protein